MKSTHTTTSKPNNINLYGDAVKTVYFSIYQLQKSNVVKNKNRLSSNLSVLVSKWHIICFPFQMSSKAPHTLTLEKHHGWILQPSRAFTLQNHVPLSDDEMSRLTSLQQNGDKVC